MAANLFNMKKIITFILGFVVVFGAIFLFRNFILEKVLVFYVQKQYAYDLSFDKLSWKYNRLRVNELILENDELRLNIDKLQVPLSLYIKPLLEPNVQGANIHLKKFDTNLEDVNLVKNVKVYDLNIKKLKIKKNTYQDIFLQFHVETGKLNLYSEQISPLGPNSKITVNIERNKENDIYCADLKLDSVSPYEIINIAGQGEKVYWNGEFSGDLKFCIDKKRQLLKPHLLLNSDEQGLLDVKDKKALEFMRHRMDQRSFNALIDNLNNYVYNNGIITLHSTEEAKVLAIDLKSEAYGTRRVEIVLHD